MSAAYDWPLIGADPAFAVARFALGALEHRVGNADSEYTGSIQSSEVPFAARRRLTMTITSQTYAHRARVVGFLSKVRRPNRARIPILTGMAPVGTMRGTPVVAGGGAAQGARSVAVTTSTSGETINRGDHLGITTTAGVQLVTVTDDATGTGTALTIAFEAPLRAAANAGAAVVWNAPAVEWMLMNDDWQSSAETSNIADPLVVEFMEWW